MQIFGEIQMLTRTHSMQILGESKNLPWTHCMQIFYIKQFNQVRNE